jgi:anthranilate synthase component 2
MTRILLLDNHDSFTYNLAELLRIHGKVTFKIITPERVASEEVDEYDGIIFSPGPGRPDEHPVMNDLLKTYAAKKSFLGVCLGMQTMALHFGASMVNLGKVVHGQPRQLKLLIPDHFLFLGISQQPVAGLYHSWAVSREDLPPCLDIVALSPEGIIMALTHVGYDICGVQFHPESIMTPQGQQMLDNWIDHIRPACSPVRH